MDDLTPMEPEFREEAPEQPSKEPPCYYGTAVRSGPRTPGWA